MPDKKRSHSADRHRPVHRRTAVSFTRVFKHLLIAGAYLPLAVISLVGILDWRDEDWIILLMASCFSMGAHVSWLSVRFAAWKKRQRTSATMQVVG